VGYLCIIEGTNDLEDTVYRPDVGQERISETSAGGSTLQVGLI
jgi:hypothetical protein